MLAQREVTKRKCLFAPGDGFVRACGRPHRPRFGSPEHVGACRRCLPSSPSAARWQGLSRFRHDSSCDALEGRQHRGRSSCAPAGNRIDRGVARPSTPATHRRFIPGHCGRWMAGRDRHALRLPEDASPSTGRRSLAARCCRSRATRQASVDVAVRGRARTPPPVLPSIRRHAHRPGDDASRSSPSTIRTARDARPGDAPRRARASQTSVDVAARRRARPPPPVQKVLSLGYFSLDQQREVTRPRKRTTSS